MYLGFISALSVLVPCGCGCGGMLGRPMPQQQCAAASTVWRGVSVECVLVVCCKTLLDFSEME